MFGHHDDKQPQQESGDASTETVQAEQQSEDDQEVQSPAQPAADGADTPDPAVIQPDAASPQPGSDAAGAQDSTQDPAWQHPGAPSDKEEGQISDIISPAGGFPKRPSYQYPSGAPEPQDSGALSDDPAIRELIDVKEHALDELAPLLDKLDLPPEEKFRAVMMIIQANDDKALVKAAYAAAHAIEDEEVRARALYTIVNEVDYFTQSDNA